MPRLLPRLLRRLEATRLRPPPPIPPERRPQPKPYGKPSPIPPCPPLSPRGRTQSIILDSLAPIMAVSHYRKHKGAAPRLRVYRNKRTSYNDTAEGEVVRAMTEEERQYAANPYLRMLSTPVRLSVVGTRHMPEAFLIRFAGKRMQGRRGSGRLSTAILPDTLEHPAFKPSTCGRGYGMYVMCRRDAIAQMRAREPYKRLGEDAVFHAHMEEQVGHLLRVRILQELHILARHLKRRPWGAGDAPLLRRLTRAEWKEMRSTGTIPYEGAIAVLVVPPLNRNTLDKARPTPSMSTSPPPAIEEANSTHRSLPPLSILMPADGGASSRNGQLSALLPQTKVPLYNGLTLCPSPEQRAALHSGLVAILEIERKARYGQRRLATHRVSQSQTYPGTIGSGDEMKIARARGDEKGGHAFLLRSDAKTIMRADTVPLAIALWRLRMWEGQGWEIEGVPPHIGPWGVHPLEYL